MAGAGLASEREFRQMDPELADALTLRVIDRQQAEREAHHADVKAVIDSIGAVIKAIGGVQRAVGVVVKAISNRPTL